MGGFASQMIKSIEEEYCFDEKYRNRPAIKPLSDYPIYSAHRMILPRVVDDDSMLRRRMLVKEFRSQRSAVVKLPPIGSQKQYKVKTTKSEGSINENDLDPTLLECLEHSNTTLFEAKKQGNHKDTDTVYHYG